MTTSTSQLEVMRNSVVVVQNLTEYARTTMKPTDAETAVIAARRHLEEAGEAEQSTVEPLELLMEALRIQGRALNRNTHYMQAVAAYQEATDRARMLTKEKEHHLITLDWTSIVLLHPATWGQGDTIHALQACQNALAGLERQLHDQDREGQGAYGLATAALAIYFSGASYSKLHRAKLHYARQFIHELEDRLTFNRMLITMHQSNGMAWNARPYRWSAWWIERRLRWRALRAKGN